MLEGTAKRRRRIDLMAAVVRDWIGGWRQKEMRGRIETLLRARRLGSSTGKVRVKDQTEGWAQ